MDLYDRVRQSLLDLTERYRKAKEDGELSISDILSLLTAAVGHLVQVAEALGGTGEQKRAAVLAAAQRFYEEVIRPLDIPLVPNFLEKTVVDPLIGRFVPMIVGGLIDGVVGMFNWFGWPVGGGSGGGPIPLPPSPPQGPGGVIPPPPGFKPY